MPAEHGVYILASGLGGTLYIGATNNLVRRVYQHRTRFIEGFTRQNCVPRPVYFEQHIAAALLREKPSAADAPPLDYFDRLARLNGKV